VEAKKMFPHEGLKYSTTQVTDVYTSITPTQTVARDINNPPTRTHYSTHHKNHTQKQLNNTPLKTEQLYLSNIVASSRIQKTNLGDHATVDCDVHAATNMAFVYNRR
jgi:hypothetical protein